MSQIKPCSCISHVFVLQVFVLDRLVEGANVTMLTASIFSGVTVLIIIYVSCRSLPLCSCFDSITGLVSSDIIKPEMLNYLGFD